MAETCSCSLCNKFYTYLYHHIVVLDKYIHSSLLMDGVNNWLLNLAARFFDEGLQKLVSRYGKCLNVDGNYVEK